MARPSEKGPAWQDQNAPRCHVRATFTARYELHLYIYLRRTSRSGRPAVLTAHEFHKWSFVAECYQQPLTVAMPHRTLPYLHCKCYRPDTLCHCAVYGRRLELSILATPAAPGSNAGLPTYITRFMPTHKQMRAHAVTHHNELNAGSSEHNEHRHRQFIQ